MDYLHVHADKPWYNYYLISLKLLTANIKLSEELSVEHSYPPMVSILAA